MNILPQKTNSSLENWVKSSPDTKKKCLPSGQVFCAEKDKIKIPDNITCCKAGLTNQKAQKESNLWRQEEKASMRKSSMRTPEQVAHANKFALPIEMYF